ncbi:MAG: hypothetical protein Q4C56_07100, partial [Peptococcaceae bacterium]|nr:hypothetical protein [Peptococcaceae bacterium]
MDAQKFFLQGMVMCLFVILLGFVAVDAPLAAAEETVSSEKEDVIVTIALDRETIAFGESVFVSVKVTKESGEPIGDEDNKYVTVFMMNGASQY